MLCLKRHTDICLLLLGHVTSGAYLREMAGMDLLRRGIRILPFAPFSP
jgi:hypothetical protein